MATTNELVTADELLRMTNLGRCELIEGVIRMMSPAGFDHGAIISEIHGRLWAHVIAHRLGQLTGAETGFKLQSKPDTVRAPDVGFVRAERIALTGRPKNFFPGAPDLAVEVVSPGDTLRDVTEKVHEWLAAGTIAVWVANPKSKTVTTYRSPTDVRDFVESDSLTEEGLLPGFRCAVRDLFV